MGEIYLTTRDQKIILDAVGQNDFLRSHFYFTGGTALSTVYLQHRHSDDIDLFSQKNFDNQIILTLMEEWSKQYSFSFNSRFVEVVFIFNLIFADKEILKVDFAYYPYRQIEEPKMIDNILVDSLTDIAVNKLFTIQQRTEIKDFVDLYFLLQKFSLWDLIEGVRIKFHRSFDHMLLAADFTKVTEFTTLPRMIKPLSLDELQTFFTNQAKELGMKAVE